ncbi:DUF3179 domain-containing protein [Candidatus Leptofilum sp.]|uniref:DUF3179 domain-containing protein n=1 Tax=Candidatus Leptofilum sp. TaxID=3241576 RepID=UPI003B592D7C
MKRPFSWIIIFGLLLAACQAGTASEPAVDNIVETAVSPTNTDIPEQSEVADPTEEPEPEEPEQEESEEMEEEPTATPESSEESDPVTQANGTELFTTDDRSDRLASLTRDWNTNWNLRTISTDELLSGGPPRDGIPSIDNPQFIFPDAAEAWLAGNEPVIAVEFNGDARAYPLQILTWHEIVNDEVGGVPLIVTFCPLCNSAIVFERTLDGEPVEFGTSGLLRNSDLVMYDRKTETLWQQFTGEGLIGDKAGEQLTFLASAIISFDDFRAAHPDGVVLSQDTGFSRNYGRNPYAGYDTVGNNPFLFDGELDERLPAVARVVTVSLPDSTDIAYPLDVLFEQGVINDVRGEQNVAVFHVGGTASALGAAVIADAEDVGATGVFDPVVDGQLLTFRKDGELIIDNETGSTWNIVGQAIDGELAGQQLQRIVHGDHFWFSWAAFKPDTIIYQP